MTAYFNKLLVITTFTTGNAYRPPAHTINCLLMVCTRYSWRSKTQNYAQNKQVRNNFIKYRANLIYIKPNLCVSLFLCSLCMATVVSGSAWNLACGILTLSGWSWAGSERPPSVCRCKSVPIIHIWLARCKTSADRKFGTSGQAQWSTPMAQESSAIGASNNWAP